MGRGRIFLKKDGGKNRFFVFLVQGKGETSASNRVFYHIFATFLPCKNVASFGVLCAYEKALPIRKHGNVD